MRTIRFLLAKEFRQIFRNPTVLAIILVVPVVQLLILPLTANYEVKNINLSIVTHGDTPYTRKLIEKITASGYFRVQGFHTSYSEALPFLESDQTDIIMEIPPRFEKNLVREGKQTIFMAANAINGVKAGLGVAYLNAIVQDFNREIRLEWAGPSSEARGHISLIPSNWYNPNMRYQLFMVPGILAILVTMIAGYLSALNIVKEKEAGTIEQINVTPIGKHHFIFGKLIPFWILGMFVFSVGMVVSRVVYGVASEGSLVVLYCFLSLYLLAVLGLGLLISTYAETQQQAMFIAFFFVMIFILMSGLFTSADSMPEWARMISRLNPVTYFIEVMRMVVLKGSGFSDIRGHILAVILFACVFNGWAIFNYKKTS